jgi:hypothetical protein
MYLPSLRFPWFRSQRPFLHARRSQTPWQSTISHSEWTFWKECHCFALSEAALIGLPSHHINGLKCWFEWRLYNVRTLNSYGEIKRLKLGTHLFGHSARYAISFMLLSCARLKAHLETSVGWWPFTRGLLRTCTFIQRSTLITTLK